MISLQTQWNKIMETSIFTEDAILTLKEENEGHVIKGIFCSGTYEDSKPTSGRTVRSRYVQGDYFVVALSTLPSSIIKPHTELREALLKRGDDLYKVKEIIGKDGGSITLELAPCKSPVNPTIQGGDDA